MNNHFSEQINSLLSTLKTTYERQGPLGRILLPALVLLVPCCLCPILVSSLTSRNAPTAVPSPNILPTGEIQATPTALFDFDFPTFTPFPTLPFATPFPSLTPLPTESPVPTQTSPAAATATVLPTATATVASPTASSTGSVEIVTVDKPLEYVDIQNTGSAAVNLSGWRLVSETGNQACPLSGVLQPNDLLRIWARQGNPGVSCGYSFNVWNDDEADPAVLYNPNGVEVSRYP